MACTSLDGASTPGTANGKPPLQDANSQFLQPSARAVAERLAILKQVGLRNLLRSFAVLSRAFSSLIPCSFVIRARLPRQGRSARPVWPWCDSVNPQEEKSSAAAAATRAVPLRQRGRCAQRAQERCGCEHQGVCAIGPALATRPTAWLRRINMRHGGRWERTRGRGGTWRPHRPPARTATRATRGQYRAIRGPTTRGSTSQRAGMQSLPVLRGPPMVGAQARAWRGYHRQRGDTGLALARARAGGDGFRGSLGRRFLPRISVGGCR